MITTFILDMFYAFAWAISRVVASFGEVSDNNAVTSSITTIKTYYMSLNIYLPIDTILQIASFVIVFETSFFLYKLVRWGYQKIPGIS